jgi:hypothetical protein
MPMAIPLAHFLSELTAEIFADSHRSATEMYFFMKWATHSGLGNSTLGMVFASPQSEGTLSHCSD